MNQPEIRFTVLGRPQPKGSGNWIPSRSTGKPFLKRSSSDRAWESLVALAAQEYAPADGPWDEPVTLDVDFFIPQPKSRKGQRYCPTKPDLDKLIRSIGDAITGVLIVDDARIVSVLAVKRYDDTPRAEITLRKVAV